MATLKKEIEKRRTFAIISHPDAGKTTMTEKLLVLGGAIQMAGTVKARKADRYATSDWMELEKQRGISVTTSVMQFEFLDYSVNLLDTPGHKDFSEDTYRTLTAVDSALMIIDSAKGVEPQTIKLMEVCRMRNTPIVTFMNKLDREGLDPFDLLENVEEILNIDCVPLSWPIGMGKDFRGVYDIARNQLRLFDPRRKKGLGDVHSVTGPDDPAIARLVGDSTAQKLADEVMLVAGAGETFDREKFLSGKQTPVFFGSALSGFGVEEMFTSFVEHTPPPGARAAVERLIQPDEAAFSGFVFKIQANMDPRHRDRIAFMRVCSGKFTRGHKANLVRLGREVKIANPIMFFAKQREIVEEAFPGDIVGIHDTGLIQIGDSFTDGEELNFRGIPSFAPELFRRVHLENPLRMKNLRKGLEQLAQEGAVQLFVPLHSPDYIVGVVGQLQLEVLQHRLEHEYSVEGRFEDVPYATARWYRSSDPNELARFEQGMKSALARDVRDRPVFLAESNWRLNYTKDQYPKMEFFATSDGLSAHQD